MGCLIPEAQGEGVEALVKATEGLAPGAASPVVETKKGYHIVTPSGRLPAGDVEQAGRRSVARGLMVKSSAEAAAQSAAKRLISAVQGGARLDDTLRTLLAEVILPTTAAKRAPEAPAVDEPASFDPRVPKAEVSAPFGVDGEPIPGALGARSPSQIAFGLAKVDDVHPEPIPTMFGLVVLQLKEKTMATREEFASRKSEATSRLRIAKQADALARYVDRLRRDRQSKISFNERILDEPKAADRED